MPRKLVISQYVSLDGVTEDPVGMEGSGLGDWTGPFTRGPEGDAFKVAELFASDALLLGPRGRALAQLCHPDGNRQCGVDARV